MNSNTPDFENEKEFQKWLREEFLSYGWNAHREVSPIGSDYRADLVVYHENFGYIGIECKYMSSLRNGKKVGEAIEQIAWKYRGEKYIHGEQIDLWAFCPYIENVRTTGIRQAIREALCHLGIAIMWPGDRMMIDFAYSSRDTKILLGDENGGYGDRERINNMVSKKIDTLKEPKERICQYDAASYGCSSEAVDAVSFDGYKLHLCEHHLRQFEKKMVARDCERRSSENKTDPGFQPPQF